MYKVWHVEKYKITFKLVTNRWTNKILKHCIRVSSGQYLGLRFSTNSRIFFTSEYFHNKIFIHENCLENYNDKFQENLLRPVIIEARSRYRAVARRLRNNYIRHNLQERHLPMDSVVQSISSRYRVNKCRNTNNCE